jgi:hypothetical protein
MACYGDSFTLLYKEADVVRRQPYETATFYPQEDSWYSFLLEAG